MAMKIRKGDKGVVTTGRDKGKAGTVLRAMPRESRLLVQGVNLVKRHTRPSATGGGGIIEKEAPIHAHHGQPALRRMEPGLPGSRHDARGRRPSSSRTGEHTSELQSLMRTSYAVFCLKTKTP